MRRVWLTPGSTNPYYDHTTIHLALPKRWLVKITVPIRIGRW